MESESNFSAMPLVHLFLLGFTVESLTRVFLTVVNLLVSVLVITCVFTVFTVNSTTFNVEQAALCRECILYG